MNDEQLDKILKKALTPQREIKEEEIVLKKRRKEEKMMRKKTNENGRYCRYRGGCTGTCLHCSTDIFCGAAKKDVSGVLGTAK